MLCCNLCRKIFDCSDDLVIHFAQHFAPGDCPQCNQQLLQIGDQMYHLQLTTTCDKESTDWILTETEECSEIKPEMKIEQYVVNEHMETLSTPLISHDITAANSPQSFNYSDDFLWPDYPDDAYADADIAQTESTLPGANQKRRYRKKNPRKPRSRSQSKHSRKYECYICKKSIDYLPPLQRHVEAHFGGGPTCDICGKQFANSQNLKVHKRLHSGQKPFICSYCGKSFNQSSNLVTHIICHTGTRDYECEVCGKSFGRSSNLIQHRRVHTGEKPHKCEMEGCDKAYMYSIDLKRHMYGAHRIYYKKYVCNICGKILPENKLLVAHMKSH